MHLWAQHHQQPTLTTPGPQNQSRPPLPQFRMQFPRRPHARRRENGRISTVRVQNLKCLEGNCMRNVSPADERQPQGLRPYIDMFTMRARSGSSAKKFAQRSPSHSTSAKKFAQHTKKQRFSPALSLQGGLFRAPRQEREMRGELFRAHTHYGPRRANFFALAPTPGRAGRTLSRSQPLKAEQGELFRARDTATFRLRNQQHQCSPPTRIP